MLTTTNINILEKIRATPCININQYISIYINIERLKDKKKATFFTECDLE